MSPVRAAPLSPPKFHGRPGHGAAFGCASARPTAVRLAIRRLLRGALAAPSWLHGALVLTGMAAAVLCAVL